MSTHWIRYTTLTWVERHFGYAVARAFAGHFDKGDAGTTTTYVRATIEEVSTALAALTNEEHPLAATASAPDSAELSEERYFELVLHRANRALATSRWT